MADVPLSVYVSEAVTEPEVASETIKPYDKIFCSYSHKDAHIVERVEAACWALGLHYLRDVHTLRSGERWSRRLLELIEIADIFQLFWSIASADSQAVKHEWQHAVGLQDKPINFIRPVYWKKPMPTPPQELAHIQFRYQPELAE